MIAISKLYILIPVAVTQGRSATRKLQLVQLFCCKVAWSTPGGEWLQRNM